MLDFCIFSLKQTSVWSLPAPYLLPPEINRYFRTTLKVWIRLTKELLFVDGFPQSGNTNKWKTVEKCNFVNLIRIIWIVGWILKHSYILVFSVIPFYSNSKKRRRSEEIIKRYFSQKGLTLELKGKWKFGLHKSDSISFHSFQI